MKKKEEETKDDSKSAPFGFVRGAPQVLVEQCKSILINGEKKELTEEIKKEVLKSVADAGDNGFRSLGLAMLEDPDPKAKKEDEADKNEENPITNIGTWKSSCFIGTVLLSAPLFPDVSEHVSELISMGMKVIIVTGDHQSITEQVAKSIGWTVSRPQPKKKEKGGKKKKKSKKKTKKEASDSSGDEEKEDSEEAEEGEKKIRAVSLLPDDLQDRTWLSLLEHNEGLLVSQMFPEHKYSMVATLQGEGSVVAMVGDGSNDVPAMNKADVSIAVSSATGAALAAAGFKLIEPGLGGLVKAIEIMKRDTPGQKCMAS